MAPLVASLVPCSSERPRCWARIGLPLAVSLAVSVGCGSSGQNGDGVDGVHDAGDGDADADDAPPVCDFCTGDEWIPCDGEGQQGDPVPCGAEEFCVDDLGCVPCVPGQPTCVGNEVWECGPDGQPDTNLETCDAGMGEVCSGGACATQCETGDDSPSNIGCEFWAVDLPNSRGLDDASGTPWGVVLANAGTVTSTVVIERNVAPLGEAPVLETVENVLVPVGTLRRIELPQAELTGIEAGEMADDADGTAITNHAFRIRSTSPIVVYQFNNFVNDYSTDASLLLPAPAFGQVHRIIGYPTANPIEIMIPGAPNFQGIPDWSSVTVVAKEDGTVVSVTPSTATRPGEDPTQLPAASPSGAVTKVEVTLDAFEVLNIASDGIPGDLSGTVVNASKPVAVFTSGERGIGPAVTEPPEPPGYEPDDLCCTDHLEEQVAPAASLGSKYVIPHSPYRSPAGGYREPDELRFLGVAEVAHVTTNLPAPWNDFFLGPGQIIDAWTQGDTIVTSDRPIAVAQVLVSQGFTPDFIGDPSLTVFPPVDQFRSRYVFLVPDTWIRNYIVMMVPADFGGVAAFTFDQGALPATCETRSVGAIDGVMWESITCPMEEGPHFIEARGDFGLLGYGYGGAGSYAYVGGADVEVIYDVPPIG